MTAWTQGRPLLPALRNSGRVLTIPLREHHQNFQKKKKKKKECLLVFHFKNSEKGVTPFKKGVVGRYAVFITLASRPCLLQTFPELQIALLETFRSAAGVYLNQIVYNFT